MTSVALTYIDLRSTVRSVKVDELLKLVGEMVDQDSTIDDPQRVAESMARAFRAEVHAGQYLSGAALGRVLNTSKQAVQQRAARGSLVVISDERGVRYPIWQIVDGRPVPGLARVIQQARRQGIDDTSLASWIEQDATRLGRLRGGEARSLLDELPHRKVAATRTRTSNPAQPISD